MNKELIGSRILGVDPGLNITGYGVIEVTTGGPAMVEAGVVRSRRQDSMPQRLQQLYDGVADVIESLKPATMSLEELYSHYERPRTAIIMGHARGVICLAAGKGGIGVTSYAATKVKKMLTGSGRAPKTQVQMAICREFSLASAPEPPDVADALAIALCHYYHISRPTQLE